MGSLVLSEKLGHRELGGLLIDIKEMPIVLILVLPGYSLGVSEGPQKTRALASVDSRGRRKKGTL